MPRRRWIPIGQSRIEKNDLDALSRAWRDGQLVLCLGAGVSQPYGLPNWNDLVVQLLLTVSRRFQGFLVQYRRPLAQWLTDRADLSLPALARIVEHAFGRKKRPRKTPTFPDFVRQELYRNFQEPSGDTSLKAVARLVQRGMSRQKRAVPLVATFNFDDLLEEELSRLKVSRHPVCVGDSLLSDGIPVLHLGGCLPRSGPIPPQAKLVFTEEQFHQVSSEPYDWSGAELIRILRRYTVLFVGLSMTDPNLRRFLDIARNPCRGRMHYVLRTSYTEPGTGAIQALQTSARLEARRLGSTRRSFKTNEDALESLRFVLRQAKNWDEWLFEEMGVRPVWVERYQDIPLLLDKIG